MDNTRTASTWWTLKIAVGLVPFLAGLDKFANVLTNWAEYLNPAVVDRVPVAPELLLQCVGAFEMLVGLAILTRWTRPGAYLAALWLAAIAANLISMGRHLDVAVYNLLLSMAAVALARLTASRRSEPVASVAPRAEVSHGEFLQLNL